MLVHAGFELHKVRGGLIGLIVFFLSECATRPVLLHQTRQPGRDLDTGRSIGPQKETKIEKCDCGNVPACERKSYTQGTMRYNWISYGFWDGKAGFLASTWRKMMDDRWHWQTSLVRNEKLTQPVLFKVVNE